MNLTRITAPSIPITLMEAKSHCRITHDDENGYLDLLIAAAHLYAEHYCQRAFGEQTWQVTSTEFPCQLAKPPLVSIDWVKYYTDDVLTTWDAAEYRLDLSTPGKIVPVDAFPNVDDRPDAVQVQYVCGMTASENVKLACLIMVSHWFETREPIVVGTILAKVPWSAHALLDSEKWGDYS